MKKKSIIIISLLACLTIFLNMRTTVYSGLNTVRSVNQVPLYYKIYRFIERHNNHKNLTNEIIPNNININSEKKILLVTRWLDLNIKEVPKGVDIIDFHPWTVIERKMAVSEQFSDILSILLVYAGVDSFWMFTRDNDKIGRYPLTLVKIEKNWTVIDPLYGLYFSCQNNEFCSISQLKKGGWQAKDFNQKIIDNNSLLKDLERKKGEGKNISLLNYYNTAFLNIISEDNILKMNRYDWHGRSLLQSPFTRLIYELRQLVKN